ncbi:MAG: PQQ-binding-like beta-propeller repeat protein [Gammaproteobacteria bacterium]|nr:PQQ-binding-like beta-propeller repeat protein [Gammaproteobacteria bacterium]
MNDCNTNRIELSRVGRLVWVVMIVVWVGLSAGCATTAEVQKRPPAWEMQFEYPIGFQTLIDDGLLVVGTSRHLYGINLANGQRRWRLRNISANAGDLMTIGDAPYILISDAAGGHYDDTGTHMLAVDRRSGELVWESSALKGRVLQATVDPVNGILFVVTVQRAHGDDRGVLSGILPGKGLFSGLKREPHLHALELSTGRSLWHQDFGKKVTLQPSYRPTLGEDARWVFDRPFTLGLYHPPLAVAGKLCVTYGGVRCFNARDGQPLWQQKFNVVEDHLALSYANPVLQGDVLYTSGDNRVRVFNVSTGKQLWRSDRFDFIPEVLVDKDVVYGQLGGRFFDIKKEKWVWKGDFGAVALDRQTGQVIWKYKDAMGSITNLLVFGQLVWFADGERLLAINRKTGAVVVEAEHELQKQPVFVALNEDRRILLISEDAVAAYHGVTGKRLWYTQHPQPGSSIWRRFSAGLLQASGSVLKVGSFVIANVGGLLPAIPALTLPLGGRVKVKLINTKNLVVNKSRDTGRRFVYQASTTADNAPYANLRGGYQYFITQPQGNDQALAAVDLRTGKTDRLVALPSRYPNLVIDEANGRIYQAFEKRLVAVPLGP